MHLGINHHLVQIDRKFADQTGFVALHQIYSDRDGRYYCKRDDCTTGTIVGALAGRTIDKNDINCE
ncbi:hypothetical protein A6768_12040 [Sphingobium yanoikuyae]|uniref:Uncharacterized protein n=1 Tax=Sphingobium yanoikuyae TaxID=13690 RepID=A0A291N0F4_SPHYA|nr:hypothetical protein [Sphingobium yanoikuyae]ATI80648.1 hypothetical protein A6768_12040 [Sphingobium yanoikuyae]